MIANQPETGRSEADLGSSLTARTDVGLDPETSRTSDEEQNVENVKDRVGGADYEPGRSAGASAPEPAAVGRLSEAIGVTEARTFFAERDQRRQFLYGRAVRRWGRPDSLPIRVRDGVRRGRSV